MTQDYPKPIAPSPELVLQWADMLANCTDAEVFNAAVQWGADQELKACCEVLKDWGSCLSPILRAARRPNPPTLNNIALQMLNTIERDAHYLPEITDTIRRALEQLDD